jgi:hypothetical protein
MKLDVPRAVSAGRRGRGTRARDARRVTTVRDDDAVKDDIARAFAPDPRVDMARERASEARSVVSRDRFTGGFDNFRVSSEYVIVES